MELSFQTALAVSVESAGWGRLVDVKVTVDKDTAETIAHDIIDSMSKWEKEQLIEYING